MEDKAKTSPAIQSPSKQTPFFTVLGDGKNADKETDTQDLKITIDTPFRSDDSPLASNSPSTFGDIVLISEYQPINASPSISPDTELTFETKFVNYPFKQSHEIHDSLANEISKWLKNKHVKVEAIMSSQTLHHAVVVSKIFRQKEEYEEKTLYITYATVRECNRVWMLANGEQIPSVRTGHDRRVIYIRPNNLGKFSAWWLEDSDFKEHVIADQNQKAFNAEEKGEIANKVTNKEDFDLITSQCGYTPYSIRADSRNMSRPKYLTQPQIQSLKEILSTKKIKFDKDKEHKLEAKENLQLMRRITAIVDNTKPIFQLERGLRNRLAELYADFILQHLSNEELVELELKEGRTEAAMVTIFDRLGQRIEAVQNESYTPFQDAFRSMKEVGVGTLFFLSIGAALINGSKPLIATNNDGWDFIQILALIVISLVLNLFVNTMFNPKQIKEELVRFRVLRDEITHPSKYIMKIKKTSATLALISLIWIALNGGAATGAQAIHKHANSLAMAIFVFTGVSSPYTFQRLGGLLGLFNALWQECSDRLLGFRGGMKFIALDFLGLNKPKNRAPTIHEIHPEEIIAERRKERVYKAIIVTWRILQIIFVAPGVLLNYAGATKTGLDIFTKIFTDPSQVLDSATSTTQPLSEWPTFYQVDAFISALGSLFYLLRGYGWIGNLLSLQDTVNKYVELRKSNSILKKRLIAKEQENENEKMIGKDDKLIETKKKPLDDFVTTTPILSSLNTYDDQTTPLLSRSSSSKINLPSWTCVDLHKGVPLFVLLLAAFSGIGLGLAAYDEADSVSNNKFFKIWCGIGCALAVAFFNFLAASKKLEEIYKRHSVIEENRKIFYNLGLACDTDEAKRALHALSCIGDLTDRRRRGPSVDKDKDDHERHPRRTSVITLTNNFNIS